MKTTLLRVLVVAVCLFIISLGCKRQEPIKIGLAVNLSGKGGISDEHIRDGAMLAVEEINSRGGIKGRLISLVIKDDSNTKEGIERVHREFSEEGVSIIIGHTNSENTLKAYEIVRHRKTILLTAYTSTKKLSGIDDYIFRTSVDTSSYGKAFASLLDRRGLKNITFIMDYINQSFVTEYADETARHFKGVIKRVIFNSHEHTDFDKLVKEVISQKTEAVMLLTEVTNTAILSQKLRNAGFNGQLFSTIWTQTPDLIKLGSKAVEGISIISFVDPKIDNPEFLNFAKRLKERFKHASAERAMRSYELVHLVAEAINKAYSLDVGDIKKALLENTFYTLSGPIKFDQYGDVVRPIYEVTVKDGTFQKVGVIN